MNPLAFVKPAVRAVRAYTLVPRPAAVKIDQNENPFDAPEDLKRAVLEQARTRPWSRYPPFDPRELTEALARFAGWRSDGVLAGNGSNELIQALLLVTVGAGTRVVIPEPTFTLYALLTSILGGEALRVGLGHDLQYDAAALRAAQRQSRPALTIVCSPNNPTGGALAAEDVSSLCAAGEGLVVVDEAYHEFSGQTVAPLLERHANLVVLRTFSKAMALAGLRVGYLLASPDLVREVNKARLPYNLNFFSQAAALAALDHQDRLRANVARLVQERERLSAALDTLPGVRPFPSRANFILFELAAHDPATVFARLLERGVLVRDVSAYPRLQRCLRVSVGAPEENAAFLAALHDALAPAPPAEARR
jgi:histidinol-phosphate aminotransferase